MLLRLLRIGEVLIVKHHSDRIDEALTDKKDPISYLRQLLAPHNNKKDSHHQISPLSLLSRSLDPLGIVEPVELLLISTPIFLD
jgi:hypothetical protein